MNRLHCVHTMLREILGIVAGVLVGGISVAILEWLGHALYPPPPGIDISDPVQLAEIMQSVPFPAKLAVLIAWGAGTFFGGIVAATISQAAWPVHVITAVFVACAIASLVKIPHPTWMVAGSVVAFAAADLAAVTVFFRTVAKNV